MSYVNWKSAIKLKVFHLNRNRLPKIVGVIFIVLCFYSILMTALAIAQIKRVNLSTAQHFADQALLTVFPLSWITFQRIPDIEVWKETLFLIHQAPSIEMAAREFIPKALQADPTAGNDAYQLLTLLRKVTIQSQILTAQLPHTFLLHRFLTPAQLDHIQTANDNLVDFQHFAQILLTGQRRYIVLFQNSEELRATGGFMGSYAVVELNNGTVTQLSIQDIYQPDGQFHDFVPAPPGLQEYLSSGHGMRLPDANWNPDFPSSAQDIQHFFVQSGEPPVEGIVALNLSVIEDVLRVTGGIYMPDYGLEVNADNLSTVARSDRDTFFPGSQQKKNFLSALFTYLKLHLQQLSSEQQISLGKLLIAKLADKNIQFYSQNEDLEALAQKYHFAGALHYTSLPDAFAFYLYSVESNVGINKANKLIHRDVTIQANDYRSQITLHFKNDNTASKSAYIDYQRFFVTPDTQVQHIQVGDEQLTKWDENMVTSSQNQQFKQIGFLITTPPQSEQKAIIEVTHPSLATSHGTFEIQNQSGLPPTPYTIQYGDQTKTYLLEKDVTILP